MAEALKWVKGYIALEKFMRSQRTKAEALVKWKTLVAKIKNIKIKRLVPIATQPHRQTTKSKPSNNKLAHIYFIPPLNLTMGLEEVVKFLQGKDYVTWPKTFEGQSAS